MLTLIRRWLPPTAPAAPAHAPAPPPSPPDGPPLPAAPAAAPPAVPAAIGATEASWVTVFGERVAVWRRAVPPADAAAADAFVTALAGGRTEAIRQLPSAAREAMAACDDPAASAADVARVCERDLAVAPALLRYANSAFFTRAGQGAAESVRDAVERVGVAGVRSVLVDVTVAALLCSPKSRHAGRTAQVWSHAQRTAAAARAVAPALGASPERAYVAGLLHDVGKLVLLDKASAEGPGAPALSWPALRGALIALHEPLGGLAVLRWELGDDVARAVAGHHRAAPPAERDAVAEAVYLAERVDHLTAAGEPVDFGALWADGALAGDRGRAEVALARHLGPLLALA